MLVTLAHSFISGADTRGVMSELSQRLASLLERSVAECTEGRNVAVAFSGGLDSGLVAALSKRYASSVQLYTVGTPGSHDVEAAREIAPLIGLGLEVIELDDRQIVDNLREEITITGTNSPLTLAFEMPLYCVMRNCKEGIIVGGQGADELFAGYSKYMPMKELQMRDEMAKDLAKLYTSTKPHEAKMGSYFGKTVLYPYLDRDIAALSRNAPSEMLRPSLEADGRKKLLSDAACDLGFGFLAGRRKKAAQYGSGTMDSIRRICKARGTTYNELVAELCREAGTRRPRDHWTWTDSSGGSTGCSRTVSN